MKQTISRSLVVGAIGLAAITIHPTAAAAQDQQEVIRRAVQSAVQASVANTIQQTVRQAEAAGPGPTQLYNSFFSRPQYLALTTGGFPTGTGGRSSTTTTSVLIAPAGVVYNFAPNWFVTGTATYSHVFSPTTGGVDIDFFQGDAQLTYVAWHQGLDSIRINGDMGIGGSFPGKRLGNTALFGFTPTVDFETGVGNWIFTVTPGFGLGWTDPSGASDPQGTFLFTTKVTYLAGNWEPQLAVGYSKSTSNSDNTDGNITVTPEVNYVFGGNRNVTAGLAYQYGEALGTTLINHSHSGIVNLRVRF
jgi:hypothetical protein